MTKLKRTTLLVILLLLTAVLSIAILCGKVTKAETAQAERVERVSAADEISPQGLYTKLSFSLNGGNGQIWFTVKNQFTLFPSTVTVKVELYASDTYQESYTNMTLVASNYIYDLDQGDTITAMASTNGKQSYWKGRAYYKRDNKDWQETVSDTILFNEHGSPI